MDEKLTDTETKENNAEQIDIDGVSVVEHETDVSIPEQEKIIEIDDAETIEIEIEEGFGYVAGQSGLHSTLPDRNEPKQHEIAAITGLREELDEIKSPRTIYSDGINVATYYEWQNAPYDGCGYFVSLILNTSTIQICSGSDIFGVTVDASGFIGGQDASVPRDNNYGLVVTSGLVDVRCELDVEVGDCVVSNAYGYATKSTSDYGYRVVAKENKRGVEYAVIALGVQADVSNAIGEELLDLDSRLDAAETNIISAINVAHQAYNKASEVEALSSIMSDKVNGALGSVDKVVTDVENMGGSVSAAAAISAQAKAIAESAATSAESMRNEAVTKANEALAETSDLRRELDSKISEIDAELGSTMLELEETKENILVIKEELERGIEDAKKDVNATSDEIKKDIANTKAELSETKDNILSLQEDLTPLTTWPEGSDNPTGVAGFVAKADENSVAIGSLIEWQGETNLSMAAFKQEVADNYATQTMLSEVGDNLTLFKQEVADTYATQEMISVVDDNLTKYKQDVTDTYATQEMLSSVDNALTSYKQEVANNYATQQMLSGVEDSVSGFKQEVADTYATQEMVATVGDNLAIFKQEVEDDYATQEMLAGVDNALTSYKQEVAESYATQQMLSVVEDNLASYKQEVTDTYATQQMVAAVDGALTSYKQEVGDTYATQAMVTKLETDTSKAIADYKQEVEDVYATQEMVTKLETNASKSLSDYKQEVGDTYATQASLTSLRTDTTNAIAASEEKATNKYASKEDLTSFESETNIAMARIEQKADANGAYIQSTVSNMDKYAVGPHSQAYGFTRKQAESVLEVGMIYVPTEDGITEKYIGDGDLPTYERTFSKTYLYRWGEVSDGYGWITVDANYSATELNTSAPSVFFSHLIAPSMSDMSEHGYWYTDGDTSSGTAADYESYTLYKWSEYTTKNDDGSEVAEKCWTPVATLAGNSQNRAVSQIRQDANSIDLRVTDTETNYAGLRGDLTATNATVQTVASWKSKVEGDVSNIATIKSTADNASASIAQVVEAVGKDGKVNAASIVTAVNSAGSSVVIEANHLNLNGYVTISSLSSSGTTVIDGSRITTGLIKSSGYQYTTGTYSTSGTAISLDNGYIRSKNFAIDSSGNAYFNGVLGANTVSAITIDASQITAGELDAGKVTVKGDISAFGATIGGFTIDNKSLLSNVSITTTETMPGSFLYSIDGTISASALMLSSVGVIYNGKIGGVNVKNAYWKLIIGRCFGVTQQGYLYANGANISGVLNAGAGSSLGGWSVSSPNGYVFGKMSTTQDVVTGNYYGIGFDTNSVGTTGRAFAIGPLGGIEEDSSWANASFYVTGMGKLVAKDVEISNNLIGEDPTWAKGEIKLNTSGMSVIDTDTFCSLNIRPGFASFYVPRSDDYMGGYIGLGKKIRINGSGVELELETQGDITSVGDIGFGRGTSHTIIGEQVSTTELNFVIQSYTKNTGYLLGQWTFNVEPKTVSDERYKNTINDFSEPYESFFDLLRPRTYKYNYGTSGRAHLGFIAQEVAQSAEMSGLDLNDVAVVCRPEDENGNWTIRYGEFVSLNTWQIQKLKARVAELEKKIALLDGKQQ